jgi:hypothetical protein
MIPCLRQLRLDLRQLGGARTGPMVTGGGVVVRG